jgi:predicted kinase
MATVVIVLGQPGTGKTTMSTLLGQRLGLPVLHRDAFKEIIFDTLGWSTRAWSRQVGATSYHLLYYVAELLLQTGQDFIVESNFSTAYDTPRWQELQGQYGFQVVQLRCVTSASVLYQRLLKRSSAAERHPGHGDVEDLPGINVAALCDAAPLVLPGPILTLDTSDGASDYDALVQRIEHLIAHKEDVSRA